MKYELNDCGKFKQVSIIGNIDAQTSTTALDQEIEREMNNGFHHWVFNLQETTYLDSSGISIFIHCLCDVQENNGSIYIIAADSQVRQVLDIVGITRLIKTYDTREAFCESQSITAA